MNILSKQGNSTTTKVDNPVLSLVCDYMWKKIKNFENYEISTEGIIRNTLTKKVRAVDYSNKFGYGRITLYNKGYHKRFLYTD